MISNLLTMLEKGNDNALLRYSIGNAYYAEKQFAQAVEHLAKAVEHDPAYSAAWKLLGRCHYELEEFQQAAVVYEQGIEVAGQKGDKQAQKEMQVFNRRALAAIEKAAASE